MPRKLRLEYEGAIYHVMNRGERLEPVTWSWIATQLEMGRKGVRPEWPLVKPSIIRFFRNFLGILHWMI
jgi:hypothetical protein